MSLKLNIPPVPRLSPDLVKVEEWLNTVRGLLLVWFAKQRALGSYLQYDSSDQVTLNITTLAAALNASGLLDHGSLAGLLDDDHGQYVTVSPAVEGRNDIIPTVADIVPLRVFCEQNNAANILEMWDNQGLSVQGHFDYKGTYTDDP